MYYPLDVDKPHTSFSLGGPTRFSRGSAIQMAAGYEGLGKGAAAGGASIIYDVFAMRYGDDGSEAQHMIQWIHLLGLGGYAIYVEILFVYTVIKIHDGQEAGSIGGQTMARTRKLSRMHFALLLLVLFLGVFAAPEAYSGTCARKAEACLPFSATR